MNVFFGRYWKQLLYTLLIWILSISLTVFEIFDFKFSRVWPKLWLLTFRGHLRSKLFLLFESLYKTSYLISIDTFSPSRKVYEIFDLEIFGVWPWSLTFRGHLESKIFSPFERSYMTSYLASIDNFSLSSSVFEKFDFKVFGVWFWDLTFRGHVRWKIVSLFENPYMTSYLFSIDFFSLSSTVFEIFDFKSFGVWPLTYEFQRSPEVGEIVAIREPIHDVLSNFGWHFLSYLVPSLKYSISKFLEFYLDLWLLEVT